MKGAAHQTESAFCSGSHAEALQDLKKEGRGQLSESERAGVWKGCRSSTGDKRGGRGGGDGLERHQDG